MGNVVGESSVDSSVDSEDSEQDSNSNLSCSSTSDQNALLSDEPSRQLLPGLQDDDSSAQAATETVPFKTMTSAPDHTDFSSVNSPDNSFPLSDSAIPDNFDSSFNAADISSFLANPEVRVNETEQDLCLPSVHIESPTTSNPQSSDEYQVAQPKQKTSSHLDCAVSSILSSSSSIASHSVFPGSEESILSSPSSTTSPSVFPGVVQSILSSPSSIPSPSVFPSSEDPTVHQEDATSDVIQFSKIYAQQGTAQFVENSDISALRKDLPNLVKTYADATNLALRHPELAKEILSIPIPTATPPPSTRQMAQPSSSNLHTLDRPNWAEASVEYEVKSDQPDDGHNLKSTKSQSSHHPDRPNWAAAPFKEEKTQPPAGTLDSDESAAYVPTRRYSSRRNPRSWRGHNHTSRNGHRGSLVEPRGGRHEPPPHCDGVERDYNTPPSASQTCVNGGDNGTGVTCTSQAKGGNCGPGTSKHDLSSSATSFGHSDLGARHDHGVPIANELKHAAVDNSWLNNFPSATTPDDIYYQQVHPYPESKTKVFGGAHRQQSNINIAAWRYWEEGSDRTSQGTSIGYGNRSITTGILLNPMSPQPLAKPYVVAENVDKSLEDAFDRLNCSDLQQSVHAPTSKMRSDIPFRDIQYQAINSPNALQIPFNHPSDPKLHLSSTVLPQALQENLAVSNGLVAEWLPIQTSAEDWLPQQDQENILVSNSLKHGSASEWLPPHLQHNIEEWFPQHLQDTHAISNVFCDLSEPQHTADDWLPVTRQPIREAPNETRLLANTPDALTISDSNDHQVSRNVDPSYPSDPDQQTNHLKSVQWFVDPPSLTGGCGPSPEVKLVKSGWAARRSRQNLPAQTEAFSRHLAETYPSSISGGRGWRVGGRGARDSLAPYPPLRRNPYGPRDFESEG